MQSSCKINSHDICNQYRSMTKLYDQERGCNQLGDDVIQVMAGESGSVYTMKWSLVDNDVGYGDEFGMARSQ